jgi:hypothetical protein
MACRGGKGNTLLLFYVALSLISNYSKKFRRVVYHCIKQKKRGINTLVQKRTPHAHPTKHKHEYAPTYTIHTTQEEEDKRPWVGHHMTSTHLSNDQTQHLNLLKQARIITTMSSTRNWHPKGVDVVSPT